MASNQQKPIKLLRLQQSDMRSAWRVVGKQIGRAIQEGARTGRIEPDPHGRRGSRDQRRNMPGVARVLVNSET
jgi:hypothetical protein